LLKTVLQDEQMVVFMKRLTGGLFGRPNKNENRMPDALPESLFFRKMELLSGFTLADCCLG